MRKLVLGALIGLLAACGGGGNNNKVTIVDSPTVDDVSVCNVLTQTGCNAGEKCTWITDATMPQPLGHIGCVPDGTVAVGGACTTGMPGATGYDNCSKGGYCQGGKCKLICDQNGGTPSCPANFACSIYEGLFGPAGQPVAAGVCDPTCDPLADNDFKYAGSGTPNRPGTACTATQGCYGYPDNTAPSHYTCTGEVNKTLYHRAACTMADGCAPMDGSAYLNGCAMGYIPLLYDQSGSMQIDCIAMCGPASCWMGNCGTNSANLGGNPALSPRHQCNPTDANAGPGGTFNVATASNNGDQCMFSWLFEIDSNNNIVKSNTSDTLGFCVDHSKYKYDSNGDGTVGTGDVGWPKCDTFMTPGFGTGSGTGPTGGTNAYCTAANNCVQAADFGCVSTTDCGSACGSAAGKPGHVERRAVVDMPRMLYHRTMR